MEVDDLARHIPMLIELIGCSNDTLKMIRRERVEYDLISNVIIKCLTGMTDLLLATIKQFADSLYESMFTNNNCNNNNTCITSLKM